MAFEPGQTRAEQLLRGQFARTNPPGLFASRQQRRITRLGHGLCVRHAPGYGRNIWAIASPYRAESKGSAFVWIATTTP